MTKQQIIDRILALTQENARLGGEKNEILDPYKLTPQPNNVLDQIEQQLDAKYQQMIDNNLEIRQLREQLEGLTDEDQSLN